MSKPQTPRHSLVYSRDSTSTSVQACEQKRGLARARSQVCHSVPGRAGEDGGRMFGTSPGACPPEPSLDPSLVRNALPAVRTGAMFLERRDGVRKHILRVTVLRVAILRFSTGVIFVVVPLIRLVTETTGSIYRVGIDFATSSARTPHGVYVQMSGGNRIDPSLG